MANPWVENAAILRREYQQKRRKEMTRVCERCGRDQKTVERQDEPPSEIKRRRIQAEEEGFKATAYAMLCHRCWHDDMGYGQS